MTTHDQIKALAKLDGWREKTLWTPCDAICSCDLQEGHWVNDKIPDYLTSYDAIIPLIQKQGEEVKFRAFWNLELCKKGNYAYAFCHTAEQLSEALLRATGKWKD